MKLKSIAFLLLTIAMPTMAEKVSVNTKGMSLAMRHSDGNLSTALVATGSDVKAEGNATVTTIHLKDPVYHIKMDLKYRTYSDVDMIEAWTEIQNGEKGTDQMMAGHPWHGRRTLCDG